MKKIEKINQTIKETGLQLLGETGSYYFYPIYGENSIFFSSYNFMTTKIYSNLNKSIKEWNKSAKILSKKIQKNCL